MILNRTDDPRSALQKATRYEVWKFAKANGVDEINSESMPKPLMIKILRGKGLTNIQIARPTKLGVPNFPQGPVPKPAAAAPAAQPEQVAEIDADDDLARQWAAQVALPAATIEPPAKPIATMGINELGNEMKRLGIKRERRDNMITMAAKIEAHLRGKNSP